MSESQKLLDKLERKDKRRTAKGKQAADTELEWLALNGLDALVEAEVMQNTKSQVRTTGLMVTRSESDQQALGCACFTAVIGISAIPSL